MSRQRIYWADAGAATIKLLRDVVRMAYWAKKSPTQG